MTQSAESSLWFKGNRPVVTEYLVTAKQIEDNVAGHGWLYRPGHLGAGISAVESGAKFKLSEINYNIVAEAIQRELVLTGHSYDIAVKDAMIAWELEKTEILTELDKEFADNKYVRELDTAALIQLEITTNLRKLVVLSLKTAIEIDIEELKQELATVEQSLFPAQDALLAAKLLTAQKKKAVIPYIEIVIDKQQDIIDVESDNATLKSALIAEKSTLNDTKADLVTAREAIAGAIVDLIAARQALSVKRADLVYAKEFVSDAETTNLTYLEQYINSLGGLDTARQDLITEKKALIPFINLKNLAIVAHTAELDAWVVVKEAIAAIKVEIAGLYEDGVDKKTDILNSRVELNALRLALEEAEINLAIVKITGRTDLLTQEIANSTDLLTEREASFTAKGLRETNLISTQIDGDEAVNNANIAGREEANTIRVEALVNSLSSIAMWSSYAKTTIADIAADTEITSQLTHLLT